jgi:hypothetical protein
MGLDIVELIMSLEQRFDIEIPDADAGKLDTVRKVVEYVWAKVNHNQDGKYLAQSELQQLRTANGWTRESVRLAVREVVAKQSGVTEFSDDSYFVKDLGMG